MSPRLPVHAPDAAPIGHVAEGPEPGGIRRPYSRLTGSADPSVPRGTTLAYLMINFAPHWEGVSKTVAALQAALANDLGARVVAFNTRGRILGGPRPVRHLPAPLLLAPEPVLRRLVGRSDLLHLFSSAGERLLLPRFAGPGAILTVAKSASLERVERNIPHLRRYRFVIVPSEQERDLLIQCGLDHDRIRLIRPAAPLQPYRPPPKGAPFTILFASAPLQRGLQLSRGVYLMLSAAALLPEVRFVFAWRECDHRTLLREIDERGLGNVEVLNGKLDMEPLYASAHATILPGLHPESLIPCPQSLVDSLAHGKPVLVSRPTHASEVIHRTGTGVVFEPRVHALYESIHLLRSRYREIQPRCHAVADSTFSPRTLVERHIEIYAAASGA